MLYYLTTLSLVSYTTVNLAIVGCLVLYLVCQLNSEFFEKFGSLKFMYTNIYRFKKKKGGGGRERERRGGRG